MSAYACACARDPDAVLLIVDQWTKVKDVIRETLFTRIYRACKEWNSWTGRGQFFARMDLVRQMMFLTVEHAWPIGCGPGGVPYGRWADDLLIAVGGSPAEM